MVKIRKRYYFLAAFFAIPLIFGFYAHWAAERERLLCNPYNEYDDAFSGAIFDGNPMVPAEAIQEITFYELPSDMSFPCERDRWKMRLIRRITDESTLATLISLINESNRSESYGQSRVRMSNSLGIEIIAKDQRKTFLSIWVYSDEISICHFPEKRFAYNRFFTFRQKLHALLLEEGILAQLSGYTEFVAEQQGQ